MGKASLHQLPLHPRRLHRRHDEEESHGGAGKRGAAAVRGRGEPWRRSGDVQKVPPPWLLVQARALPEQVAAAWRRPEGAAPLVVGAGAHMAGAGRRGEGRHAWLPYRAKDAFTLKNQENAKSPGAQGTCLLVLSCGLNWHEPEVPSTSWMSLKYPVLPVKSKGFVGPFLKLSIWEAIWDELEVPVLPVKSKGMSLKYPVLPVKSKGLLVEPVKTWHNANHLDGAQNQCCSSEAHDISRANNIKIHPHYPWPISTLNPSKSDGLHPPHIPNHITNYVLIHLLHFPPPPLPAQLWPPFPSKPSSDSPKVTGRNLRVAVVGGGPAGGSAAETLAKGGIETFLIERKLDNCKPCGGAIPLCMVGEFDLPLDIIDRRVTKMKMISPSNVAVDIGQTLKPHEYIGMVRREVLDSYLRERASASGATVINGLFLKMDAPKGATAPYVLHYTGYDSKTGGVGERRTLEVDAVIGADGANSRVAKFIGAGDYDYAIAFQERIKIPDDKMVYYENLAEMYVGDDVSPDFYGWVFPKCDHVAVGTGTVTHKSDIKKFQLATRLRAKEKILGGKIIRVEAHPIPEHPRPRSGESCSGGRCSRVCHKCSGEGIYFAAKSGRMCAEAIVEGSENGKRMVDEGDLRKYLEKWDKTYWPTYKVLDVLQKVFYRSNPAREAFVEMCADEYVQKMTFDSYLYKKVVPREPIGGFEAGCEYYRELGEGQCS
ncbi:Geranylgeranyl diphosphate reductase, chloroplastic [Vitis vinifera]|uniref:Geranylgeranyl diphosphate reductase, chloroplastic n=1 Tax=Vitis vinifera TaxID=29760 RepID=A0A438CUA6_VITVI|nr:Geranylgeranyl diphosphate reductase, chloroplastic [Vitis vinifera]